MTSVASVAAVKHSREYRGKRPHTGELDKDDAGLTGSDYSTRLDPVFNAKYILACKAERQRYYAQAQAANS